MTRSDSKSGSATLFLLLFIIIPEAAAALAAVVVVATNVEAPSAFLPNGDGNDDDDVIG